ATLYALTISHDFMTPVKIKIPVSVQHIGPGAFDVFQAREFEVDKGNTIYSDLNGALMNLRGDCLIAPASDGRGTLIIPDGALSFEWDMVDYLENYTDDFLMMDQYDIILPASITQMPIEEYLYTKENLRFHCPVGSVAETYAIEHEIAYDHITDLTYSLQEVKPDDTTVLRFRIYSDHAMLEHVETSSTALTIPDTVDGKPVTTIGSGTYGLLADPTEMFSYNSNSTVESIQLPATVTEISDDSFEYFNGLTTMDLPAGLLYLGSDALPYKYDLKELPEGLVSIGRCFAGSTTTEIKLPASLKNIASDAFGHYEALQKITVDPGNTTFSDKDGVLFDHEGTTLIYYPKGGNTKYAVPEGTQYIGNSAFYNNMTIEEVTLPASLKSIDQNGFYYCSALNSIDLPEGLTEIGAHAFNNCEALKKVEFPGSVRIIDSFAFSYCSSLNEVTFNEGLEKIGPNAFYNTALTRVELPASVETIDYSAFDLSQIEEPRGEGFTLHIGPRLTDLASNAFGAFPIEAYDVDPENPSYMAVERLLTDRTGERLLSCPPGIQGELHIPDSITWLNYSSFDTAYFLTDLYIPSTVTKIESISLPSKYVKNDDDDDYHSVYKVTIHCQKGSAAETYAIENDIPYVIE
ncbi:MAG: leucine-rich repeat domain-containing protein, partial [Firmicutes bacterium]|nr:leucine-rich repeat domain-containing protein [Bacillota bacterium]